VFTVEGGHQIEIAAGRASRPYDFDKSRIYHGVIGFRGPKARGWLYDPNLQYVYNGLGLSDTPPPLPAEEPKIKKIWIIVGLGLTAVAAGIGGTVWYRRRHR
jgi:hypothetical protein